MFKALTSEIKYWYRVIATGGQVGLDMEEFKKSNTPMIDKDGKPVNKYAALRKWQAKHFIDSIPALQEKCMGDQILQRPAKSKSGIHRLARDEIMIISTFMDCKSILNLSMTCTEYYHACTSNMIWRRWCEIELLIIEHDLKSSTGHQQTSEADETSSAFVAPSEAHFHYGSAVERFKRFYMASKEEQLYNRYRTAAYAEYMQNSNNATVSHALDSPDSDNNNYNYDLDENDDNTRTEADAHMGELELALEGFSDPNAIESKAAATFALRRISRQFQTESLVDMLANAQITPQTTPVLNSALSFQQQGSENLTAQSQRMDSLPPSLSLVNTTNTTSSNNNFATLSPSISIVIHDVENNVSSRINETVNEKSMSEQINITPIEASDTLTAPTTSLVPMAAESQQGNDNTRGLQVSANHPAIFSNSPKKVQLLIENVTSGVTAPQPAAISIQPLQVVATRSSSFPNRANSSSHASIPGNAARNITVNTSVKPFTSPKSPISPISAKSKPVQSSTVFTAATQLPKVNYTKYYSMFRNRRLQNPFIRSRIIRHHVTVLKSKYEPITRWLNLAKLVTFIFLIIFSALLAVKIDNFIPMIPWIVIYLPFVAFAIGMLMLVIILWVPTLSWPLALYRYVAKDNVGWWTSYAYSLTVKGRLVQLLLGILLALSIIYGFFVLVFPQVLPPWSPIIGVCAGFFIWMYTATQIIYEPAKTYYPWFIFTSALCIVIFCLSIVVKFVYLENILLLKLYWFIIFIPLFLALCSVSMFQLRLSWHLNQVNVRAGCCVFWMMGYFAFISLLVTTLVLFVLRLDSFIHIPCTLCFIPVFVMQGIMTVYYVLRMVRCCMKQQALKNPFTWICQGGVTNSSDMDTFII